MNGKNAADRFGGIEERFIAEALEDRGKGGERSIEMKNGKKLTAVMIAAVLALVLAVTAVAVGWSSLSKIKNYVDDKKETFNIPKDLGNVDIEENGVDLADPEAPALPAGECRIASIIRGRRGLIATAEINVSDDEAFASLSPDEPCWYEFEGMNWYQKGEDGEHLSFGSSGGAEFVSLENGILTAAIRVTTGSVLPEHFTVYIPKIIRHDVITGTETTYDVPSATYDVTANELEIDVTAAEPMESVKSKNSATIRGVEFTAEMDGFGIYFKSTAEERSKEENEALIDIYNECPLTFKLKDGSEITDIWSDYTNFETTKLIGSSSTEAAEGGIYYGFVTLFDISRIESITVEGAEFEF